MAYSLLIFSLSRWQTWEVLGDEQRAEIMATEKDYIKMKCASLSLSMCKGERTKAKKMWKRKNYPHNNNNNNIKEK